MFNQKDRFSRVLLLLQDTGIFSGRDRRWTVLTNGFSVGGSSPNVFGFLCICLYALFGKEFAIEPDGLVPHESGYGRDTYTMIIDEVNLITFKTGGRHHAPARTGNDT